MFTNPVVIAVIVMIVLCMAKLSVLMSLMIAAIVGGLLSGMTLTDIMGVFVGGMGGNANTALSYVLLGALAFSMHKTGAATVLAQKIGSLIKGNKLVLTLIICLTAMASGTIVPVHIAFIPIMIPPLLGLMNKIKYDRRLSAIAFGFGLKAPYITLPVAYGAIFHGIIKDSMAGAGMQIELGDVWRVNWIAGLAMVVGLVIGVILYSKPREYETVLEEGEEDVNLNKDVQLNKDHIITVIAGLVALAIQLWTGSLPLGALIALLLMIVTRAIKYQDIQEVLDGGVKMMGYIAFVMLVAAGFAAVINETGAVGALVDATTAGLGGSKFIGATVMIIVGLLVTMGIGTSFGTVPIVAALYVPMGQSLGFSPAAIILLISVAAALGDAGSPASDTTLGPTSGLNADGQHDHIWDTCVPQFICYDIPLMIAGIAGAMIIG